SAVDACAPRRRLPAPQLDREPPRGTLRADLPPASSGKAHGVDLETKGRERRARLAVPLCDFGGAILRSRELRQRAVVFGSEHAAEGVDERGFVPSTERHVL